MVACVPTSVCAAGDDGAYGNAISSFIVPIPTHENDPRRRIAFAHRTMSAAKARHVDIPTTLRPDTNALIPAGLFGPVTSAAMRAMDAGLVGPPVNLTISDAPGPPARVHASAAAWPRTTRRA